MLDELGFETSQPFSQKTESKNQTLGAGSYKITISNWHFLLCFLFQSYLLPFKPVPDILKDGLFQTAITGHRG